MKTVGFKRVIFYSKSGAARCGNRLGPAAGQRPERDEFRWLFIAGTDQRQGFFLRPTRVRPSSYNVVMKPDGPEHPRPD
jgi:hypothetical protein